MNKLYFTTVDFYDENDVEFEAEVTYYVDKCLDTNREFVDDFEIKSIRRLTDNIETPPFTKKQAYKEYYELIMNAIIANPGVVAEEF